MRTAWAIAVVMVGFATGEAGATAHDLPLVGLDENGNEVTVQLSSEEYLGRLSGALASLNQAGQAALARQASTKVGKPWRLRTAVVGAGVELEAGLGPILKLKAVPKFRLVFSDSADPALP